jgi:hypothetical protein
MTADFAKQSDLQLELQSELVDRRSELQSKTADFAIPPTSACVAYGSRNPCLYRYRKRATASKQPAATEAATHPTTQPTRQQRKQQVNIRQQQPIAQASTMSSRQAHNNMQTKKWNGEIDKDKDFPILRKSGLPSNRFRNGFKRYKDLKGLRNRYRIMDKSEKRAFIQKQVVDAVISEGGNFIEMKDLDSGEAIVWDVEDEVTRAYVVEQIMIKLRQMGDGQTAVASLLDQARDLAKEMMESCGSFESGKDPVEVERSLRKCTAHLKKAKALLDETQAAEDNEKVAAPSIFEAPELVGFAASL